MSEYDEISRPSIQDEYDAISVRDQRKPKSAPPKEEPPDPAAEMSIGEKMLVGAGGGLRRLYLGGKDIIGQGTPEETEELKDWSKSKEHLGWAGTAGELGAETIATLPVGGAVGGAAKVLSKAVPWFERAGAYGGRFVNPGLIARGAAEGGAIGLIPRPEEGETRLGNAGTGAFFGGAAPAVFGAGGKVLSKASDYILPTKGGAERRAYKVLEKALTKEELEGAEVALRNRGDPRIPQTTAAAADSARLGEMEAGARSRNLARFDEHDAKVADEAWKRVLDDTSSNVTPERLAERVDKVNRAGRRVLDTQRVDDGARNVLKSELHSVLDSNEVTVNQAKKQAVQRALGMLEMPNLSVRGLRDVYDDLAKHKGSDAIDSVRESLKYAGDSLSDGTFSRIDKVAEKAAKDAEAVGAARGIRETFQSREGIPLTGSVFTAGGEEIPKVTGKVLRNAVGKAEGLLEPGRKADLRVLTGELRKHELYNPAADVGGAKIDLGSVKGPITRAVSVSPFWKSRPAIEATVAAADRRTQKTLDEALRDPDKFLKLIDAKRAAGQPLTDAERSFQEWVLQAPTRAVAASQGE